MNSQSANYRYGAIPQNNQRKPQKTRQATANHDSNNAELVQVPKVYRQYGIGVYEVGPSGMMIPPMARNPSSEYSQGPLSPRPPSPPSSKDGKRPALTRSSLLAAEQQKWQSRAAGQSSMHSPLSTDREGREIMPEDSFSVVNYLPPSADDNGNDTTFADATHLMEVSDVSWKKDLLLRFGSMDAFGMYIMSWCSKTINTARASFLDDNEQNHWTRDFNPVSGKLVDPVEAPETLRDESHIVDPAMRLRRRARTANSACRAFSMRFKNQQTTESTPEKITPSSLACNERDDGFEECKTVEDAPGLVHEAETAHIVHDVPDVDEAQIIRNDHHIRDVHDVHNVHNTHSAHKDNNSHGAHDVHNVNEVGDVSQASCELPQLPQPPPGVPSSKMASPASQLSATALSFVPAHAMAMSYHVRPAEVRDLWGVQEIYDFEIAHGTQATDDEPLPFGEFTSILDTCRNARLPFLVAAAGADEVRGLPQIVLGFGFFSAYQSGLSGRVSETTPCSAKVNIFVHANYRQRGIGSALLSKLLNLAENGRSQKNGAKAELNDKDSNTRSSTPASGHEHPREYHNVFAELLYGSEKGLAEVLYERVLTDKFGFQSTGKTIKDVRWSNTAQCWLSKLTFHRSCRKAEIPLADANGSSNSSNNNNNKLLPSGLKIPLAEGQTGHLQNSDTEQPRIEGGAVVGPLGLNLQDRGDETDGSIS